MNMDKKTLSVTLQTEPSNGGRSVETKTGFQSNLTLSTVYAFGYAHGTGNYSTLPRLAPASQGKGARRRALVPAPPHPRRSWSGPGLRHAEAALAAQWERGASLIYEI
jgi:hypothetical protein